MRRGREIVLAAAAWLALVAAAPASGPEAGLAWGKGEAEAYEKDLAFLLDECPKRARALLASKDVDWAKATKDLRAAAKKVKDDAEFVRLVERILARLHDGHAGIVSMAPALEANVKAAREAEARGRRWTGPRVHLLAVGKRVFVGEAFGQAKELGVAVGMEVLAVDDVPARAWLEKTAAASRDAQPFSTDHAALYAAGHWGLATWEGTAVTFALQDGHDRKTVSVPRNGGPNFAPSGPLRPPEGLKSVGRQSYGRTAAGFGYVHLRDVDAALPQQLDGILEALGDVPGLVLDCRANGGGGCDHDAVFGRFLATGARWKGYVGQGTRPFAGPMVVIVDAGVRSAGETVAGMFKEDGRAYVIGPEPTAGMSSQKEVLEVPSKRLSVRVSVASNMGRFNGGKGIEGIGVAPTEVVPYDPAELRKGVDTQIRRAEELLRGGFPKGSVEYAPPK
jgi:hypothetical protein